MLRQIPVNNQRAAPVGSTIIRSEIEEGERGAGALGTEVAECGGWAGGGDASAVDQGGAAVAHDGGVSRRALVIGGILVHVEAEGAEATGVVAEDAGGAEDGECTSVGEGVEDYRFDGAAYLARRNFHRRDFDFGENN